MATILVAYNELGCIGDKGQIPWQMPGDLAQFKKRTMGQVVIMGRKTFESLSGPLPGRVNIVLTRSPDKFEPAKDLIFLEHIEDAIDEAYVRGKYPYVIGGAQIYKEAFERRVVDSIIATEVEGNYEGDTYFPKFEEWNEQGVSCITLEEHEGFKVVEYKPMHLLQAEYLDLREEVARLKEQLRKTRAQLAAYTQQAGRRFRDELDYVPYSDEEYER
jgi:dihydrofolate reductase